MFRTIQSAHRLLRNKHRIIQQIRCFDTDGDPVPYSMKIKVDFISMDTDDIMFDAFSPKGFRLNNGIRVLGPCVAFPKIFLQWKVTDAASITEDHMSLFRVLAPKLDLLIIGVGDAYEINNIRPELVKHIRSHKLNVEILPTTKAVATYNFLVAEKRCVAAALIPPNHKSPIDPEPKTQTYFMEDSPDTLTDLDTVPPSVRELRTIDTSQESISRLPRGLKK